VCHGTQGRWCLEWAFGGRAGRSRILLGRGAGFVDTNDGTWLEWWGLDGHDVSYMTAEHHDGVAGRFELGLGLGAFGGVHHAFDGAERQQIFGQHTELCDGPCSDEVVFGAVDFLMTQDLGALADNGHVGQGQRIDDMLQERTLFGDALDQGDDGGGPQDSQDQSRDAGAATDVEHAFGWFGPQGQVGHGVEQVFADHLDRVSDGSEVELLVPFLEHGQIGIELGILGIADGQVVLSRIGGEDGKIVLHEGLRYSPFWAM